MNNSLLISHCVLGTIIFILIFGSSLNCNGESRNIINFSELFVLKGHTGFVTSVSWSPDGNYLASGSEDYSIRIWNSTTGKNQIILSGNTDKIMSVVWSPDGNKIASTLINGRNILIWNPITGNIIKTLEENNYTIGAIAWSPDGKQLASGSGDMGIKIWDITSGINIKTFDNSTAYPTVSWSPDGSKIAAGDNANNITIWDVESGGKLRTINGLFNGINCVAWNPNGTLIAAGTGDDKVTLWNPLTGIKIQVINATHGTKTETIAWSPDGTDIAISSYIENVSIWDIQSGANIRTISNTHSGWGASSVAWSPLGTSLAIGFTDGTIGIWGIPTPNVHIKSIVVDRSNIYNGDKDNITVTLTNDGTRNGTNVKLDLYDGTIFLTTKYLNVLRNDSNITKYSWQTNKSTYLGAHNLRAILGAEEKNVTVLVNGKPNVFLKKMTLDKENITVGESVNITIIIENNGTVDATRIALDFYDGNSSLTTQTINISHGRTDTLIYPWSTNNSTTLGKHNIKVILGPNEKNVTIVVNGKTNVYVQDMSVDKTNITIGKSTIITATIANNGSADATNVSVSFFADKLLLKTMTENITKNGTITTNIEWTTKKTTIGNHILRVVVGNSSKQMTVHVKQSPAKLLGLPFPLWMLILIIIAIMGIALTLSYIYYQKQKRTLE